MSVCEDHMFTAFCSIDHLLSLRPNQEIDSMEVRIRVVPKLPNNKTHQRIGTTVSKEANESRLAHRHNWPAHKMLNAKYKGSN